MSNDDNTYIDRKFQEYEERIRELERQVGKLSKINFLHWRKNNG